MKIIAHSHEEHQYLKDIAYIEAERDFLNMQDFLEELDRERKPAIIKVDWDVLEPIKQEIDI